MTEDKLRAIAAGYNLDLRQPISYTDGANQGDILGGYLLLDHRQVIVAGAATLSGLWYQLRHLSD